MFASHEVAPLRLGNRSSCNLPRSRRRKRVIARDNLHQVLAAGELAIAERPQHLRVSDLPGNSHQRRCIGIPARRRSFNQHLPRGPSHGAEFRPHCGSRSAAKRPHVIRHERGIAHHHLDRVKRHAQLFGHLLRKRCPDVLAHFHFAGEHFHLAIGGNVQPRAQILGQRVLAKVSARFLRHRFGAGKADEQSAAEELQESAPIQLPPAGRSPRAAFEELPLEFVARAHRLAPSAPCCAARLMAARMRGYVPHRHTFPFIAVTISSSLGLRLFLSSAVALTIIPDVQ